MLCCAGVSRAAVILSAAQDLVWGRVPSPVHAERSSAALFYDLSSHDFESASVT